MRTFVSIELPEKVRKEIFRVSKRIRDSGLVSGTFVSKDNIHLTLRFLGELTEEQISKIRKSFSDFVLPKFEAHTGEIGFFPSEKYVKVIWIDFVSDELSMLKGIVENKLQGLGINKETREFNAHITFARIRQVKDKEKFLKLVEDIGMKKMNIPVEKISLIKSELTKNGPKYKLLDEFSLI